MTLYIATLLAAYLIGAIPTGVVLTRLTGAGDVRQVGSGNIGATNVYRNFGRRLGVLTLFGDALKGFLPLLLVILYAGFTDTQIATVAALLFLGHCYPVYLGFKGGKGVATALGIFAVLSPLTLIPALVIFVGVVWKWRYISLGSICAAGSMPLLVFLVERSLPLLAATLFIAAMVIFRHRSNIERLSNGTESKFRA